MRFKMVVLKLSLMVLLLLLLLLLLQRLRGIGMVLSGNGVDGL